MRAFLADESGASLVEFAVTVPFVLFIVLVFIGLTQAIYAYDLVAADARAGTRYAVVRGSRCAALKVSGCPASATDISKYVTGVSTALDTSKLIVTTQWPGGERRLQAAAERELVQRTGLLGGGQGRVYLHAPGAQCNDGLDVDQFADGDLAVMDAPRSRGQVMPIFLIALVPFLLLAALVVDVGSWRDSQRQLQSAADSAAVAAAAEIPSHDATAAAAKAAAADGVVDGSGGVTLTVNIPPRSGNYTSDTLAAEVIVKKIQTSYFAGLADQNGTTVKVRAVARLDNGGPCLLTLSSDHNSLDLVNGSITMPACAIADNGGLHINQASIDAASVTIVEHPLPDPKYFSKATPPPVSLPYTDQCAAIPGCAAIAAAPPSPSSCSTEPSHVAAANVTLDPGTYCGGLQINNSTVHLNPGLYYMEGDLSISNATVIGDGVTLYFASGGFKTANADIQLSAPATGFGAGVLLYQPASNSSDIRITNPSAGPGGCPTINAPADNPFYGAVYAPAAQINLTNGLWTPTATIASSVKMRNADWCYGNPGGSPILHPVLAE